MNKYIIGKEVTVSVKALYDSELTIECGWIDTEDNEKWRNWIL